MCDHVSLQEFLSEAISDPVREKQVGRVTRGLVKHYMWPSASQPVTIASNYNEFIAINMYKFTFEAVETDVACEFVVELPPCLSTAQGKPEFAQVLDIPENRAESLPRRVVVTKKEESIDNPIRIRATCSTVHKLFNRRFASLSFDIMP